MAQSGITRKALMGYSSMKTQRHKPTQSRHRLLGDFRLMFGRHAGKPIRTIPFAYLRWAVTADGEIPAADRWAIKQFLREVRGRRKRRRRAQQLAGTGAGQFDDGDQHGGER